MSGSTIHKVGGSISIYIGIASLVGFTSCILKTSFWVYQSINNAEQINWGTLSALVFISVLIGGLGLIIVKSGWKEFNHGKTQNNE